MRRFRWTSASRSILVQHNVRQQVWTPVAAETAWSDWWCFNQSRETYWRQLLVILKKKKLTILADFFHPRSTGTRIRQWLMIEIQIRFWGTHPKHKLLRDLQAEHLQWFSTGTPPLGRPTCRKKHEKPWNPPAPKVLGRDLPDGTRKRLQVYLGGGGPFFGQNLLFLIGRDARLQKTL